jgi:opacity protein-like surface antigen
MVPAKTNLPIILLFATGLFVTAASSCPAQDQDAALPGTNAAVQSGGNGFVQGGAGYFAAGLHFSDLQLPGRETARFVSVGGSGYGVLGRHLLLGGAGHRLVASGGGFEREDASASARYGLFTVGYLFRPAPWLYAYPQVGLGAGNLDVEIGEDTRRADGSLEDPSRGASYEKRAFLLRLGGGLEYRVQTSGVGSLLVGIEAGYLFPAGESVDTNGNFAPGLDASMQGPFVRLTFGGGT